MSAPAARPVVDLELVEGQSDVSEELVESEKVTVVGVQVDVRRLVWDQPEADDTVI